MLILVVISAVWAIFNRPFEEVKSYLLFFCERKHIETTKQNS